MIRFLAEKTADADVWPDDATLASYLNTTNLYGLRKSRIVMIFEAIERELVRSGKTETFDLATKTVEHILPQGWRKEPGWNLPPGLDDLTAAGLNRDRVLHTAGNLTLVTWGKNSELSNHPWQDKQQSLAKHTSLQLNRDLQVTWPDHWDETTIAERAATLASTIRTIWPSADAFENEIADR